MHFTKTVFAPIAMCSWRLFIFKLYQAYPTFVCTTNAAFNSFWFRLRGTMVKVLVMVSAIAATLSAMPTFVAFNNLFTHIVVIFTGSYYYSLGAIIRTCYNSTSVSSITPSFTFNRVIESPPSQTKTASNSPLLCLSASSNIQPLKVPEPSPYISNSVT